MPRRRNSRTGLVGSAATTGAALRPAASATPDACCKNCRRESELITRHLRSGLSHIVGFFALWRAASGNPSPPPPPRSGEGEQNLSFSPSPLRGGGGGEGLLHNLSATVDGQHRGQAVVEETQLGAEGLDVFEELSQLQGLPHPPIQSRPAVQTVARVHDLAKPGVESVGR